MEDIIFGLDDVHRSEGIHRSLIVTQEIRPFFNVGYFGFSKNYLYLLIPFIINWERCNIIGLLEMSEPSGKGKNLPFENITAYIW